MAGFFKKHGMTITIVGLLGVAVGLVLSFIFSDPAQQQLPFINERVLFNPPDSVYNMRELTEEDHIWGSLDAPIILVEYSDLECPSCKRFHYRMQQIVNEYGGDVAWVFRHHPLDHRFQKSRTEAEASECAARLGGNASFWRFVNRVYETTTSNDGLDLSLLPVFAEEIGLNRSDFQACMDKNFTVDDVEDDFQDARRSGLSWTPSSIIVWGDDRQRSLIIGGQREETLRNIFNLLLGETPVEEVPVDANSAPDFSS